jgi:redox-sensitive bicupin YhaK (pirin superfamily)
VSDLAFPEEASRSEGLEGCADDAVIERTPWRTAEIAPGVTVERALPLRKRRTVGAWCFLDLAGPFDPASGVPMDIGPHPHIGLQTVTWLFDGEVLHRDSLGSVQTIRPGQLNLMTSGGGVVHSEHSPRDVNGTGVHLAQLWIALPDGQRHGAASFEHHAVLPVADHAQGVSATVIVGHHAGLQSPATVHSPLVGLDVALLAGAQSALPIDREFEHAAIVISGEVTIAGESLRRGELLYLGRHRTELPLTASVESRLLIVGGEPFESEILMWWNFVARTRTEIVLARDEWMRDAGLAEGRGPGRFPMIDDDPSPPIPAPPAPWNAEGRATPTR